MKRKIVESMSIEEAFKALSLESVNKFANEALNRTKPSAQLMSVVSQLGLTLNQLVKKEGDEDFSNADTYTLVGTSNSIQAQENKLRNIKADIINEKGNTESYIRDYEIPENGTYVCVRVNKEGRSSLVIIDRRTMIEKLTEGTQSEKSLLPRATWVIESDDGEIVGEGYNDKEQALKAAREWVKEYVDSCNEDEEEENWLTEDDVNYYIYQDFESLDQQALTEYLADIFEDIYRNEYQYYKRFAGHVQSFIKDNYDFPVYQANDIEVASYNIAWSITEILEERCNIESSDSEEDEA